MAFAAPLIFEDSGSGEAVVMIHGLGGTSNTFQPLMAELAQYRVIRPDMPGSGRSALPLEPLSIEGHAASVLAALVEAGISRAHFVGHSMGTLVCQHIAATAVDCVASLTLFGALTEPGEGARTGLVARAAVARKSGMQGIADQIIAATLSTATHAENPAAVAFVRESILRQPGEGYARNCEALSRAKATDLRQIKAPTLLVAGSDDPVAPASIGQVLADGIAGAAMIVLDRCGHWITLERARVSAGLLREHLARHRI
ncbi:MAG: alpha/beta fold hydrolase [Cypionkella sp.]